MSRYRTTLLFLALAALVALVYLPGLWGPFLLDDYGNLSPLQEWLSGYIGWQSLVFGNTSGPLGRPLTMATFLVNAAAGGLGPFGFKLGNLLLHLGCMGLAVGFLRSLLRRDPALGAYAALAALGIALWWAILPIHASTVLYVVQRMAQISALFIFAGLWLYVHARGRMEGGHRDGAWLLWTGIPVLTALGAFGKENALLLPLICAAVEFGYFSGSDRPRHVKWFFFLFVGLPAVVFAAILLLSPDRILGGYERRLFGPVERLLTEPRVLWSYARDILIPFGPRLGLFHDNYPVSTGLFQPITTMLAIVGWIGATFGAWWIRRSAPAVITGLLLFLFGHAMESSIFPMELVFLHRNYMPSLGLLLAVAGLVAFIAQRVPRPTVLFRRTIPVLLAFLALGIASATFGRALVWQSELAIFAQELETNPSSVRTRTAMATYALQREHPRVALAQIEALEEFAPKEHQATIVLWKLLIVHCQTEGQVQSDLLQQMKDNPPEFVHPYASRAMMIIASQMEAESCGALKPGPLADAMQIWLASFDQPDTDRAVAGFRYNTGRMLAKAGRLEEALHATLKAWNDGDRTQFPIGVLAFRLAAALEDYDTCREVLEGLEALDGGNNQFQQRVLQSFREFVENPEPGNGTAEPSRKAGESG